MTNYNAAKCEAKRIWKEMCLSEPPLPILEVAENYGLSVRAVVFSDLPVISSVIDIERKIIYINERYSIEHQRFSIAHELGHWILHKDKLLQDPSLSIYYIKPIAAEKEPVKKEVNCFAVNLLVPKRLLKKYGNLSNIELAVIFAVSRQVIGYQS